MNNHSDPLCNQWSSLGVAFYKGEGEFKNVNPEQTIIDTIKSGEFPSDKKMFGLMLLWISKYHDLIHVERLKSYIKKLSPFELAVLAAISKKILDQGDFRFKAIIKEAQRIFGKNKPSFSNGDDELFISIKGTDEDFLEFGIRVAPMLADDPKKLLKREYIIKNNVWLKNRLLFGTNLRADFITVFTLELAGNAYQAARILNCSLNASYRNWKDIAEARGLGFI